MECPICMEELHTSKNFISTECGHCFHASCLMANVAHNGFGCPYCRTVMIEKSKSVEEDDDDDDDDYEDDDEDELYDDSTLRGFRFFMNNLSGESHEQEDLLDEEELNQEQEQDNRELSIISHQEMTQKLLRKGLTIDDVVKIVVLYEDAFTRLHEIYSS
jgi:hypothetical protein